MPIVDITETEINPTYIEGHGGGQRTATETEINPTSVVGYGGGHRTITATETNPTYKIAVGLVGGLNPALMELLIGV